MKPTDVKILINALEQYCAKHKMRFTPSRGVALEVIARSNNPIGAYDVIEEMGKVTEKPKPTTVYRAIDFLQEHGFIHKIESLSAFVACHAGHSHQGSQFIICNDCGKVEEVHLCDLPQSLKEKTSVIGFEMKHWNAEIHGVCKQCAA